MRLSELTSYAARRYGLREQTSALYRDAAILASPVTGRWTAVLLSGSDPHGFRGERCDIRCGRDTLEAVPCPYITEPFRMKAKNGDWVGIVFEERTDPKIVFWLFDRAVRMQRGERPPFTEILPEIEKIRAQEAKRNVLLPEKEEKAPTEKKAPAPDLKIRVSIGPRRPGRPRKTEAPKKVGQPEKSKPEVPGQKTAGIPQIPKEEYTETPQKIREMRMLYRREDVPGDTEKRSAEEFINFYRQGKFMEAYADDVSLTGACDGYITSYQDMSDRQLREYFTWRKAVREGKNLPIGTAALKLYLKELLCGIGPESAEDRYARLLFFDRAYDRTGKDQDLKIHTYIGPKLCDFAIYWGLPRTAAQMHQPENIKEKDRLMLALKYPSECRYSEIYEALADAGRKAEADLPSSLPRKQKIFLAAAWGLGVKYGAQEGKDLFALCFGKPKALRWRPFGHGFWMEALPHADCVYELNAVRGYICRDGIWEEEAYTFTDKAGKQKFARYLEDADIALERYLNTGEWPIEMPFGMWQRTAWEEAWRAADTKSFRAYFGAEPETDRIPPAQKAEARMPEAYFRAEPEKDRIPPAQKKEGARPPEKKRKQAAAGKPAEKTPGLSSKAAEKAAGSAVAIDLSKLERIRRDALATSEKLLTEEERKEQRAGEEEAERKATEAENKSGERNEKQRSTAPQAGAQEAPAAGHAASPLSALPPVYREILETLLSGRSPDALLGGHHLMPSVVSDGINEALLEEVGDSVLVSDGRTLALVPDYREDVGRILGDL